MKLVFSPVASRVLIMFSLNLSIWSHPQPIYAICFSPHANLRSWMMERDTPPGCFVQKLWLAWFFSQNCEEHPRVPSREVTCPTLGKGKASSKVPWEKDMFVPRRVLFNDYTPEVSDGSPENQSLDWRRNSPRKSLKTRWDLFVFLRLSWDFSKDRHKALLQVMNLPWIM